MYIKDVKDFMLKYGFDKMVFKWNQEGTLTSVFYKNGQAEEITFTGEGIDDLTYNWFIKNKSSLKIKKLKEV